MYKNVSKEIYDELLLEGVMKREEERMKRNAEEAERLWNPRYRLERDLTPIEDCPCYGI